MAKKRGTKNRKGKRRRESAGRRGELRIGPVAEGDPATRPPHSADGQTARRSSQPQPAMRIIHPRCAIDRAEDLEEVRNMLQAGEIEIAREELRWLLEDCSDCIEAHQLLGQMAMDGGDFRLARGHFGYAYDIVVAALPGRRSPGTLPYRIPENRAFFRAAVGLARCLWQLGKRGKARDVLRRVVSLDPIDPMHTSALLAEWDAVGTRGTSG